MTTKYTRTKLCKEFRISEKTLTFLEKYGIVELDWKPHHGLLRAEITPKQADLLSCAAIDIHSLTARHSSLKILPFHRFITLRFFQVEADELYDELVARNLIHPRHVKPDVIEQHYGLIFENLPEPLKKCALAKEPPTKKVQPLFDSVVEICGLRNAYDRPDIEQSFEVLSETNVKILLEAATTSSSTVQEICSFLTDCLDIDFSPSALLYYQWLFSDFRRMRSEDLDFYLKSISKTHRDFILAAFNNPISELKAEMGLVEENEVEELYELARRHTTGLLLESMKSDSLEAQKNFHTTLKQFMAFVDRDDRKRLSSAGTKLPKTFTAFEISSAPMEEDLYRIAPPEEDDKDGAAAN